MNASVDVTALIEQVDIVKEISKYVQLKPKAQEYTGCCPFHQEATPSFFVNPVKKLYYCFGCQSGGNVINFRAQISGLQFKDALTALATEHGLNISFKPSSQPLKDVLALANGVYKSQLVQSPDAQDYINKRKISSETQEQFQIGYIDQQWQTIASHHEIKKSDALKLGMIIEKNGRFYDRFRGRLMFPIHDHFGSILGFGGRTIDDSKPKYLNSSDSELYHKRKILYGLHQAIKAKSTHIIVVEGYMDVIALHQAGFKGAVASLGTAFTHEQFELICQYGDRLTFCFDGDEAGRRASMKAFETLLPYLRDQLACSFLFLPSGEDPDSFIQKHGHSVFQEKLDSAIGFTQFLEKNAALGLDLSQLDQKAQFLKRLHEKTALMPTSIMKKLLLTKHQFKAEPNNLPKIQKSKRTRSRLLEIMFSHPNIFKQYRDTIRVITYLNPLYRQAIDMLAHDSQLSLASFCHQTGVMLEQSQVNKDHDTDLVHKELKDIIYKLKENSLKHEINSLVQKSKSSGLSEQDTQLLQSLLKQKRELQKT